jgi:O-antigen/teichoic acid export membrane protein
VTDPFAKRVLASQGTSLLVLLSGFAASLLVTRTAVARMGVDAWGGVALILAMTAVPLLLELGLTPALTRALLTRHSAGEYGAADALFLSVARRLMVGVALAVAGMTAAFAVVEPSTSVSHGVVCIALGGAANALTLAADLLLVRVRVAQRVHSANLCRASYYLVYLGLAYAGMASLGATPVVLFSAQAASAVAYAALAWSLNVPLRPDAAISLVPWRELVPVASAEQLARIQSSLLPALERSLILANVGAAQLAYYDIAQRTALFVTAIPAALAGPLGPLYGPCVSQSEVSEARRLLRMATVTILPILIVASAIVVWLSGGGLAVWFGVAASHLQPLVLVVAAGSAMNVSSAIPVSFLYAAGRARRVVAKSCLDLVVAVCACMALFDGLFWEFLIIRYSGYAFGVIAVWTGAFSEDAAVRGAHEARQTTA